MLRVFTVFASILLLISATLVLPPNADARRCGEEPPKSLLSLYRNSSGIHIARFQQTQDIKMTEDEETYSVVEVSHQFTVASTLKGEPVKFVGVSDTEYRSKNTDNDVDEEEAADDQDAHEIESEEAVYGIGNLKPGDEVLLFVRKGEEEGSFVLTDYRDSAKKLSSEKMTAYERGINELNTIFSAEKVNDADVVAWLVKTAKDPLTRWEGAFELLSAVQNREWRREYENNIKEKLARGEKLEEWEVLEDEAETDEQGTILSGKIKYADLLTESQKQELMEALLDVLSKETSEVTEAEMSDEAAKKQTLGHGDEVLLELVARWGDDRLANYLLNDLRNASNEYYVTSRTMERTAMILKDDEMIKLASQYSDIFYMEDDEDVEGDAGIDNDEAAGQTDVQSSEDKPKVKMTYGQLRNELLTRFLERADSVMADPERQLALK